LVRLQKKPDKTGVGKMPRKCPLTGKKTRAGRKYAHRGKAKYLGGVGIKITGKTKRKFKANIQRVRAVVDGGVKRINVSAKAIRNGLIVKPPRRNYQPEPEEQTEEQNVEQTEEQNSE
jgi:large subunit ribosomal protein L28